MNELLIECDVEFGLYQCKSNRQQTLLWILIRYLKSEFEKKKKRKKIRARPKIQKEIREMPKC